MPSMLPLNSTQDPVIPSCGLLLQTPNHWRGGTYSGSLAEIEVQLVTVSFRFSATYRYRHWLQMTFGSEVMIQEILRR